jgi:tRNA-specific 2-thiouridylase
MRERVLIAMSGGVDSSVAAARLLAEGFDVVGVTFHLWDYPDDGSVRGRCCAPEDVHDARRVADVLGIAHYAFDRREAFRRRVVEPFVEQYLEANTPSPCVRCNRAVKFDELFALRERLGARYVATGHYARIGGRPGAPVLLRARDRGKDQSYFLYTLTEGDLDSVLFPLGDLEKTEVRRQALELNLPGSQKGESQELCFVPTGRYDEFVRQNAKREIRPGPIVDASGRVVARHAGVHAFTIGQRRNLGVAVGSRAYVVALDAETATVKLGSRDELLVERALVGEPVLHRGVELPMEADVLVRYRAEPRRASIRRGDGDRIVLDFAQPVSAVVPGQYAVFYQGERVVGGGRVEAAERRLEGAR